MRFSWDMAALPRASRLQTFRNLLDESLSQANDAIDYAFSDDDFVSSTRGRLIGEVALATSEISGHTAWRDRTKARRATEENMMLVVNLDTPFAFEQDGREATPEAGDGLFLNLARAYKTTSHHASRVYLRFPKAAIVDRFGPIDDLTGMSLSAKAPVQRMATNFFADLGKVIDQLDDSMADRLVAQGFDLLALAMAERVGHSLENTTAHRSAVLFRLKSFLTSRLRDPNLSLVGAAAAFGVSPRYINRLLATEQTSFGRFVLEKRLQNCHRDLANPARFSVHIIDVAFAWGFKDPAHFSRAFKARFGISPRDHQRRCLTEQAHRIASRH